MQLVWRHMVVWLAELATSAIFCIVLSSDSVFLNDEMNEDQTQVEQLQFCSLILCKNIASCEQKKEGHEKWEWSSVSV